MPIGARSTNPFLRPGNRRKPNLDHFRHGLALHDIKLQIDSEIRSRALRWSAYFASLEEALKKNEPEKEIDLFHLRPEVVQANTQLCGNPGGEFLRNDSLNSSQFPFNANGRAQAAHPIPRRGPAAAEFRAGEQSSSTAMEREPARGC